MRRRRLARIFRSFATGLAKNFGRRKLFAERFQKKKNPSMAGGTISSGSDALVVFISIGCLHFFVFIGTGLTTGS